MSSDGGSGDFVAGFVFGAFVGAALALLFAPAPGEEIRHQLHDRSIELRDRAETLGAQAESRAEELKAKGQSLIDEQRTRFQEAIEEGKVAASRKKEELLAQLDGPETPDVGVAPSQQQA